MPRSRRAQGRPGTRVIPTTWGRDHAPVVTKAMRGTCQALPPGDGALVFDPTEKISKRGDVDPTYDGPCRIQILNAQDQSAVVAEQAQITVGYLVTLSLLEPGADEITTAHRIKVTATDEDPSLVGKTLSITSLVRGTERFERDLFCTEDQSSPAR